MTTFSYLVLFLIVGAIGFTVGQISQYRGRTYLHDLIRQFPTDMQSTIKYSLFAIGSLMGLFFLAVLIDEGPGAFIPFFFLTLWLLATTWVYLDAKERGGRAKAWAMLTFFTFVFGLCGYLITRPDKPRSCPRCAYRLRDEFLVCPYCGPQAGLNCHQCQAALEPNWRFCPYCQTRVLTPDPEETPSDPPSSMRDSPSFPPTSEASPFTPA